MCVLFMFHPYFPHVDPFDPSDSHPLLHNTAQAIVLSKGFWSPINDACRCFISTCGHHFFLEVSQELEQTAIPRIQAERCSDVESKIQRPKSRIQRPGFTNYQLNPRLFENHSAD